MFQFILSSLIFGGVGVAVAAQVWARTKVVDLMGGRRKMAPKFHPISTFLCNIDEFCLHFFGFNIYKFDFTHFIEKAKELPHDEELFGSKQDFLDLFGTFCSDIQNSNKFSLVGQFFLRQLLNDILESRKAFIEYFLEHRELANIKIEKPLVVIGSGRSGSTLTHNLLCQQPGIRALQLWEVIWGSTPIPPVTEEEYNRPQPNHPKYQNLMKRLATLRKVIPTYIEMMSKTHPIDPKQYEEEVLMLTQTGLFHPQLPVGEQKFIDIFHSTQGKKHVYLYLKRYMQLLQSSYPPKAYWVLKGPFHTYFLDTFLEEFPDARVVVTHRNMASVLPSGMSLYENVVGHYYRDGAWDRHEQAAKILPGLVTLADRLIEFRARHPRPEQFVDVPYPQLMKDPIGTVKMVHEHFGIDFGSELEKRLEEWKAANPQGKQGRHSYSLETYGFDPEDVKKKFQAYHDKYLPESKE